jgi:hypothetical protein
MRRLRNPVGLAAVVTVFVLTGCSGESSRDADAPVTREAPNAAPEVASVPSDFYAWGDDVPDRQGKFHGVD